MNTLALVGILAVLVEGLIEYLGEPIPSRIKPHVAALVAVLVCLAYDADLLAILGFPARIPYAGAILTGLVIGRGSNYLADVVKRVSVVPAPATTVEAVQEASDSSDVTPIVRL